MDRLFPPPAAPAPAPEPPRAAPLARAEWAGFLGRQYALDSDKRDREVRLGKRACRAKDGPIYERLFRDSTAGRREPAPREIPATDAVGRAPSFASPENRPPRALRSPAPDESPEEIRSRRFSPASQEIARRSPSLKKRARRACDLKVVLEGDRARRREIEERRRYCEQFDE
jgi:hypothetical protein